MNTPYKHAHILSDNVYEIEADDAYCVWRNRYDAAACCTHIAVEITYPDMDECDKEAFTEYAYSLEEITRACRQAGCAWSMWRTARISARCAGQRALFYYGGETGRRGE